MKTPRIELVYFDGCPNTLQARENIRAAARRADGAGATCAYVCLQVQAHVLP